MNDNTGSSPRLDALEMRIAYQDHTIAELNEVIAAQWRKLDAMARKIAGLRDEIQGTATQRGAPDPPPPHY